jgi:hypothetical protein
LEKVHLIPTEFPNLIPPHRAIDGENRGRVASGTNRCTSGKQQALIVWGQGPANALPFLKGANFTGKVLPPFVSL